MYLFKNNLIRSPDKPSLRKVLLKDSDAISMNGISKNCVFVIDGGGLLHRLLEESYDIFRNWKTYATYVRKHYNDATVVFDGYKNEPTKSFEQ